MPKIKTGRKFRPFTNTSTSVTGSTNDDGNSMDTSRISTAKSSLSSSFLSKPTTTNVNIDASTNASNRKLVTDATSGSTTAASFHKNGVDTSSIRETDPKLITTEKSSSTAETTTTTKNTSSEPSSTSTLSKGQKKRLQKREQYLRKERMIQSTLNLREKYDQSKRIDGLNAIKNALMNIVHENENEKKETNDKSASNNITTTTTTTNTIRKKKNILPKEVVRMNLILQHPSFQSDPLSTIQEHLTNTFMKVNTTSNSNTNDDNKNKNSKRKSIGNNEQASKKKHHTKYKNKIRPTRMKNKSR